MDFQKLNLYYNTIKHQEFTQLFFRLKRIIKSKIINTFPKKYNTYIYNKPKRFKTNDIIFFEGDSKSINIDDFSEIKKYQKSYQKLSNNKFDLLNKEFKFKEEIDWNVNNFDQLWVFNLYYFDYLFDLAVLFYLKKDKEVYNLTKNLIQSWIYNSKPSNLNNWHPYVISLRGLNWIKYYLLCKDQIEEDISFKNDFLDSLYLQIKVLDNNLEYHLGGNHLLENGKTLIFAGLFFESKEADNWFDKGLEIIKTSIENQILDDGGHYEKSPMYHSIVLKDYLEIIHLLKRNNLSLNSLYIKKIKKMIQYLKDLTHPDDEISFFNDSAMGIEDSPDKLFSLAEAIIDNKDNKSKNFDLYTYLLTGNGINMKKEKFDSNSLAIYPQSGYYRIKNNKNYLIFDCGDIGPDENPGHAHCDTLSYELSYHNQRWLVNSGTYSYHNKLRNEFRSTAAHNTLRVNKEEQSQIWSKFRIANRAKAKCNFTQKNNNILSVQGEHDGYKPLIHQRTVILIKNEYWLILDKLNGKGKHLIENYLHFHPKIYLEKLGNNKYLSLYRNKKLYIQSLVGKEFSKEEFYYSKTFNQKEKSLVLVQRFKDYLPSMSAYLLIPENIFSFNITSCSSENYIEINFKDYKDIITINNKNIDFTRKS